MQVPLLDLKAQYATIRAEVEAAIAEVMESQNFILGPKVEQCEKAIAQYSNRSYAVGVSSGTDALLACLMAENIGPGDEVITTPYTFFATVGAIARVGATPVFVDIDPVTYSLDVTKIASKVTSKTRAIIPVHLYGQMADMDAVMAISEKHGLVVFAKLPHLDEWTAGRQRNARKYDQLFQEMGLSGNSTGASSVALPTVVANRHIFNQYVIRVSRRDHLQDALQQRGIGTEVYYPVPMHLQECFGYLGHKVGAFPESESAAKETVALPIYPELSEAQLRHVVESIRDFLSSSPSTESNSSKPASELVGKPTWR